MLFLFAKILESLVGPLLRSVTVPAIILVALVSIHGFVSQRDSRLKAEATNICDAKWESAIRTEERDLAQLQLQNARRLLQAEHSITEGLRDELDNIEKQHQELQDTFGDDNSKHCLSRSVLDVLWNNKPAKTNSNPK